MPSYSVASSSHALTDQTSSGLNGPHHSDLWFGDGNLIIQAEDKQFKVHQGVLSRKSPVFSAKFSALQIAGDSTESAEECPIVVFHDSKADVAHMLLALYQDTSYFDMSRPISVSAVSALLRMGNKYDIRALREAAVTRLSLAFPDVAPGRREGVRRWKYIEKAPFWYHNLATLVYQERLAALQPRVFFECVNTVSFDQLVRCFPTAYGTPGRLAPELVETLVSGKEALMRRQRDAIAGCLPRMPSCSSPMMCVVSRDVFLSGNFAVVDMDDMTWDPEWLPMTVCPSCAAAAELQFESECDEIWSALPSLFGLPPREGLFRTAT